MAIPFLNHLDLLDVSEIQNAILHKTTSAVASDVEGKIIYDTGTDTIKYYNGSAWISVGGDNYVDGASLTGSTLTLTRTGSLADLTVDLSSLDDTVRTVAVDTDGDGTVDNTLADSEDLVLKKGSNITLTEAGGVVTISATDTNTNQLTTWDLIDDDDDSFTISHNKNVKFTAATGTAGTNISGTGTDADPYVVAITLPDTNTNTGADMTEATLRSKLASITENVTIGDGTDVQVTASGNLVVTGDLVVSGDTITANVGTLDVEDKNITLNYHATDDTSGTADGAGITIQDAVNSTTDATILWDATNDKFDFSHSINAPSVFLNGTEIDATATELNQLDGVTVGGTSAGDIVTIDGTQTLTNKTISASQITEISNLTADEGAQLENINSVTISNTQWGYLGGLNQGLTTTSDVAFNSLDIEGGVDVNGTLEADAITVNGSTLNSVIDGRITAREYKANFPSSATSAGDTITITHNLDTRDVIVQFYALVADIDGDANTPNVDQYEEVKLENIRATTNTITVAPNTGLVADALRVLIKEL